MIEKKVPIHERVLHCLGPEREILAGASGLVFQPIQTVGNFGRSVRFGILTDPNRARYSKFSVKFCPRSTETCRDRSPDPSHVNIFILLAEFIYSFIYFENLQMAEFSF